LSDWQLLPKALPSQGIGDGGLGEVEGVGAAGFVDGEPVVVIEDGVDDIDEVIHVVGSVEPSIEGVVGVPLVVDVGADVRLDVIGLDEVFTPEVIMVEIEVVVGDAEGVLVVVVGSVPAVVTTGIGVVVVIGIVDAMVGSDVDAVGEVERLAAWRSSQIPPCILVHWLSPHFPPQSPFATTQRRPLSLGSLLLQFMYPDN
jgi:hypothetical protein